MEFLICLFPMWGIAGGAFLFYLWAEDLVDFKTISKAQYFLLHFISGPFVWIIQLFLLPIYKISLYTWEKLDPPPQIPEKLLDPSFDPLPEIKKKIEIGNYENHSREKIGY